MAFKLAEAIKNFEEDKFDKGGYIKNEKRL